MTLPSFNSLGVLPPGDYQMTLQELASSFLVIGGDEFPDCDRKWCQVLVERLSILVRQLWAVGIDEIYIDGSFVEDKIHPNDIDGYFVCDLMRFANGDIERELNLLDPHKVWTWEPDSRRSYAGQPKKQLPMWLVYRVEFYPHFGQRSGIKDKYGHDLEFPSAFRQSRRDGNPKGIIQIVKEGENDSQ
jgi:hypothetical protein